jgi:cyclopropane fatty-acyl-phospholipid synthase-like methyltransferase
MTIAERVFFEAFANLPRLAPGSDGSTRRAVGIVRRLIDSRRILDLGCGTGAQTMVLARETNASILAVDTHRPFLDTLAARAAAEGLDRRIRTACASMADLDVEPGSVDVIWAEGAIYLVGFDAALAQWRGWLAPGGVVACSELCWLTDAPSVRAREFWCAAYPGVRGSAENVAAAERLEYECVEQFVLPAEDWAEYCGPLARNIGRLRAEYASTPAAVEALDTIAREIGIYEQCGGEFGYVFYVLQAAKAGRQG